MTEQAFRLKQAREAAGYETAADFARAHNLSEGTYRHHENGIRGIKTPSLLIYADLLNVSLDWLLTGREQLEDTPGKTRSSSERHQNIIKPKNFIPIIGDLQAGDFREEIDEVEPLGFVDDYSDKRSEFSGLPRYAKRVIGPSMNNQIPHGSIAILVSLYDLGRNPKNGEIVEVVQRRKDGLVEATLKKYVENEGRKYLMPDSSHPEHREPIRLNDIGEDDCVVVRGLVVRAVIDL